MRSSPSARSTASIGMLIAGGLVFNYVVTIENIPETVRAVLAQFELDARRCSCFS